MNKLSLLLTACIAILISCSKSDDKTTPPPSGGGGTDTAAGSTVDIRGIIRTSQTWRKDFIFRLRGYVYVTDGATITIEPGTKIISNKDSAGVLVIYRDATLIANGTVSDPIVFTSGETTPTPGDLGGVILVGQAKVNGNHSVLEGGVDPAYSAFGGTDNTHSSGILKYVRIE